MVVESKNWRAEPEVMVVASKNWPAVPERVGAAPVAFPPFSGSFRI
jgi:hypothetical protein